CDVAYILEPGMDKTQLPGDGKALLKLWRFHHNRRDYSGVNRAVAIPPGSDESPLKPDDLLTRDAKDPDRIRPGNDSPLATQGAGMKDGSLPNYIGALPPEGIAAWDWDRTWHARAPRSAEEKKDAPR